MKKKQPILRRIFSHAMLLLNIGAVVWLLLCYAASIKNPGEIRFIALFSLTTPFALAANFFFVFFWLFSSKKWRMLVSLALLVLLHKMVAATFGFHYLTKNEWEKTAGSFRLMSWNTHGMGIYAPSDEGQLAVGIIDLINRESPDILCLPEFSVKNNPSKNRNLRKIINDNRYRQYRINTDHILNDKVVIGTAILTRYPLVGYKVYDLSPEIYLLECDMQVKADRIVRVYVLHLQSFGLTDEDKKYIEKVKHNSEDIKRSKTFLSRFNNAYIRRAEQAEKVADIVSKSPHPTVICGDFNDLPYSYTYTTIKGNLTDAFSKKGTGFGRTYNQIIPTLRIDHVFFSQKHLKLKAFKTVETELSDHNPVVANFEIAE